MSTPKDDLEERLRKAGIEPDVFVDVLWERVKLRVAAMLKSMAKEHGAKRQDVLVAAVNGLAVNWKEIRESNQSVAEMAERLTDAVMREEDRRSQ